MLNSSTLKNSNDSTNPYESISIPDNRLNLARACHAGDESMFSWILETSSAQELLVGTDINFMLGLIAFNQFGKRKEFAIRFAEFKTVRDRIAPRTVFKFDINFLKHLLTFEDFVENIAADDNALLCEAIKLGRVDSVDCLLEYPQVVANMAASHSNILSSAAGANSHRAELVEKLLKFKDIRNNIEAKENIALKSTVMSAFQYVDPEAAALLVKQGADISVLPEKEKPKVLKLVKEAFSTCAYKMVKSLETTGRMPISNAKISKENEVEVARNILSNLRDAQTDIQTQILGYLPCFKTSLTRTAPQLIEGYRNIAQLKEAKDRQVEALKERQKPI